MISAHCCPGVVRPVKTRDPLGGALQKFRISRHSHNRVHPRYRLEPDHTLPPAAFVGFEYSLKLVYNGFRRRRFERIDPDRLIAKPLDIEGRDHVDGSPSLSGGALNEKDISCGIDPYSPRSRQ